MLQSNYMPNSIKFKFAHIVLSEFSCMNSLLRHPGPPDHNQICYLNILKTLQEWDFYCYLGLLVEQRKDGEFFVVVGC